MTSSRALRRLHLSLAVSLTTLAMSSGLLAWALRQEAGAALPAAPVATAPPPARSAPVPVPPPTIALVRVAPPLRVLLLRSTATAQHVAMVTGSDASTYDRVVDAWDAWLRTRGHHVERIDETALAALADDERRTVVVAPSTAALGDGPLAALTTAVQRGTGLVASSQLAWFAGENRFRGDAALRTLAGIRPLPELHAAALGALEWIAVMGGGPLAAGLPAGARLELAAADRPLLVESDGAAADFVHWDLLPLGSPDAPIRPTAVVARPVGRGRVVWLNFEPGDVRIAGTGAAWLDGLRDNALAWSAGQPVADLETWPGGVRMAAVLAFDATQLDEAGAVARRFRDASVPLTTFVDPTSAPGHAADVTALASAGEVAVRTTDAAPVGSIAAPPPALERARAALEALARAPIDGLRPPDERTDGDVIAGGAAAGYAYLAGAAEADRAEPWLARASGRALVVLPRIPRGDDELVDGPPAADHDAKAWAAIRADLLQLRRLGGFYLFDFVPGQGGAPTVDAGVARLLGLRSMPEVWLTTARETAGWWRARAGAALRVEIGTDAMTIVVHPTAPAERLGIALHLPADVDELRIDIEAGPVPVLERVGETDARLEYRTLAAGELARTRIVLR